MLCEKCQIKEANAHLTSKLPAVPSLNIAASEWRDHLCEDCAKVYMRELELFLQSQPPPFRAGMSEQEKEVARQAFRELQRRHMTEWKTQRPST
jgi:protein-arginine kinase activator protein McsA